MSIISQWDNDLAERSVAWQPTGNLVAAGIWLGEVEVRDAFSAQVVNIFSSSGQDVFSLSWSPNGQYLAGIIDPSTPSVKSQAILRIWDMTIGKRVMSLRGGIFTSDTFYASSLEWSPDGTRLASTSDDGKVYLWDGQTFEPLGVYQLHDPLDHLVTE